MNTSYSIGRAASNIRIGDLVRALDGASGIVTGVSGSWITVTDENGSAWQYRPWQLTRI